MLRLNDLLHEMAEDSKLMKKLAIALAITIAALLVQPPSNISAQPQVTFIFPADGETLSEPPPVIRMCFATPVNIENADDFSIGVVNPDGHGLGLRIVFQRDGLGVDVHLGLPADPASGNWQFEWRVTDSETMESASGTLNFSVIPGGSPKTEVPGGLCRGGTATPVPQTPMASTPTPIGSSLDGEQTNGEGSDVLLISLLTAATAIGLAAIGFIAYLFRRKIGSSIRRRSGSDDGDEG